MKTLTLAFVLLCTVANAQYRNFSGNSNTKTSASFIGAQHTGIDHRPVNANMPENNNAATADESKDGKDEAECTVPATPGPIAGSPVGCFHMPTTYRISAVPGATSYTWSAAGGGIVSSIGTSITINWSYLGKSVSVKANNSCGSSSFRKFIITEVINCG